jgi:hypothetical protein
MFIARNIPFYWAQSNVQSSPLGGTQPTTFQLLAQVPAKKQGDSILQTVTAAFNVVGPTAVQAVTPTGQVLLTPDLTDPSPAPLELSLGQPPTINCQVDSPQFGIEFKFTATAPTNGPGTYSAIQLIDLSQSRVPVPGATPPALSVTNGFELDNSVTYDNRTVSVASGSSKTWCATDSPGTDTNPEFASLTRLDSFRTYFVYKPNVSGAIWVPLGELTWSWGGTVTQTKGTWTGPTSVTRPSPSFATPVPYQLIPLPSWSATFK